MFGNNFLALIFTFGLSIAWLRLVDFAAHRGWIESKLSRKIIHIGTGPIFVLCWLLFINTISARFMAALIPFLITVQFFLIGIGIIRDEAAVQAMSRTGDRREILYGPLFYGIIFVLITIVYWYDSPIGITALMILCGGDGMADIIGRRFGSSKLPWAKSKSWAGSLGMFLGGWILTVFVISIFVTENIFSGTLSSYILSITIINLVATFVETLPIKNLDNITVAVASIIVGHLFF